MKHISGFLLSCLILSGQQRPISDWRSPAEVKGSGVWILSLLIPDAEFTGENVEALARRFLAEDSGEYDFVCFTFGTIESGLYDVYYRHTFHEGHERTAAYFAEHGASIANPIAQMVKMGKDAVIRYRRGQTLRTWQVLGEGDPTRITSVGVTYDLIGLDFKSLDLDYRLRSVASPEPNSIRLFLRTLEPLRLGQCEAAGRLLSSKIRAVADVYFRNDPFFVGDGGPAVYAFDQVLAVPSQRYFYDAPEVGCLIRNNSLKCTGVRIANPSRK